MSYFNNILNTSLPQSTVLVSVMNPPPPETEVLINGVLFVNDTVIFDTPIEMVDGTNSVPGLKFSSDVDTGIFRSSDDTIGFSTGGITQITIDPNTTYFENTTAASDTVTGAVVVAGGLGVSGKAYLGDLCITGSMTVSSDAVFNNDITIEGDLSVNGTINGLPLSGQQEVYSVEEIVSTATAVTLSTSDTVTAINITASDSTGNMPDGHTEGQLKVILIKSNSLSTNITISLDTSLVGSSLEFVSVGQSAQLIWLSNGWFLGNSGAFLQ